MSTENFLLAFGRSVPIWCAGAALGWLFILIMNANLGALMCSAIPMELQKRIYAMHNSLQFFTIPLGCLLDGALMDNVFEPLMARHLLVALFDSEKGAGATFTFFLLAIAGVAVCLCFRQNRHIKALD